MNVFRRVVGSLLAAGLCAIAAVASARAAQPPWAARIDGIFSEWSGRTSPGCAVGIDKDGGILFERGYGMADLEHDVPIAPAIVFYVGSLSKQFTAFAAALAIQDGRLSPDDPIRARGRPRRRARCRCRSGARHPVRSNRGPESQALPNGRDHQATIVTAACP